ncbi:hypothetical protein K432DRAFT_443168 [Lepidopterella palustris CBS 459.81]|uniref:Uncharacterized protein n=1 Tax=Lepidopterella palustris CBS 459.81 TaxID=1314670 RepID=A0A8E2EAU7_9PEZI|nr:hypothetical protein K432DRAFT_443168 [Lepidopterella palustris CBS 459.81]
MTTSFPTRTRRWIGLVLLRLIETYDDVLNHLQRSSIDLTGLGQVITTQSEDLKLVAGMIIRKMVMDGSPHARFWSTDAITLAIPEFPSEESQVWMEKFQDFVDDLHGLKFISPANEVGVLYAVAITAEDGVQCFEETGMILLLIERRNLTAITPSSPKQIMQCFDIPVTNIAKMELRKAMLHSAQGKGTGDSAPAVTMHMDSNSWTYLYDAEERYGKEMSILFRSVEDAIEAMKTIQEEQAILSSQDTNCSRRKMSSSHVLDISRSLDHREEQVDNIEPVQHSSEGVTKAKTSLVQITTAVPRPHAKASRSQMVYGLSELPIVQSPNDTIRSSTIRRRQPEKSSVLASGSSSRSKKTRYPNDSTKISKQEHTDKGDGYDVPDSPPRPRKRILKPTTTNQEDTTSAGEVQKAGILNKGGQNQGNDISGMPNPLGTKPLVPTSPHVDGVDASELLSTRGPLELVAENERVCKATSDIALSKEIDGGSVQTAGFQKSSKPAAKRILANDTLEQDVSETETNKENVYDIPPDDSQRPKKRVRRAAAKRVNYDESGELEDNNDPEYVQTKPKQQNSNRKMPATRNRPKPKSVASTSKKKQTKVDSRVTQAAYYKKAKVLGKLLSHTKPAATIISRSTEDHRSQAETDSLDSIDDGIAFQSSPSPRALFQSSPPRPKLKLTLQESPAETQPPRAREAKRIKHSRLALHIDEDIADAGIESERWSPLGLAPRTGSACVNQAASPCPAMRFAVEQSSAFRGSMAHLLNNMGADESMRGDEDIDGDDDNGQLTHSDEDALGRGNLLRPDSRPDEVIPDEIMSSNSKPKPAPPTAESRAISGHVSNHVVEKAKADARKTQEADDPFKDRTKKQPKRRPTSFTQRLTGQIEEPTKIHGFFHEQPTRGAIFLPQRLAGQVEEPTKVHQLLQGDPKRRTMSMSQHPAEHTQDFAQAPNSYGSHTIPIPHTPIPDQQMDIHDDADETLVAPEEGNVRLTKATPMNKAPPNTKAPLMAMRPSPSNSSQISSSATRVPQEQISAEQEEKMEWEASLKPHHRAVLDMLTRISRRLVRQLVDSEVALTGIIGQYERDRYALIERYTREHEAAQATYFKGIDESKKAMAQELIDKVKSLGR